MNIDAYRIHIYIYMICIYIFIDNSAQYVNLRSKITQAYSRWSTQKVMIMGAKELHFHGYLTLKSLNVMTHMIHGTGIFAYI